MRTASVLPDPRPTRMGRWANEMSVSLNPPRFAGVPRPIIAGSDQVGSAVPPDIKGEE